MFEQAAGELRAKLMGGGSAWPGFETTRRATISDQTPLVWRAPEGLVGLAAVPVGGGSACPDNESTRRAHISDPAPPVWRAPRRDRWARLRCPWVAAGPGRASRRRAERSSQRGRLAGGPPPTGTHSSPAPQPSPPAPGTPVGPHSHTARQLGITKPPGPNGAGRQWR